MTALDGAIDLHSHSTASDGQYPAEQVAERAAAAGVAVWALTDHDSVAQLRAGRAAAEAHGLRFVPGIELSVHLDKREVHLLGHFVDPESAELRGFEDLLAEKRRVRMGEMIHKLAALGVALTPEEIEKFSGGKTLARPHVARAMVERGIVGSVKEAFDRFLGEGRPAFVGRHRMPVEDAIALVRGAGGAATIAHPGLNRIERGDLERMKAWGLSGVETYHADHVPSQREKYLKICAELDLVPTAGSDFHGPEVAPGRKLGMVSMSEAELERLEARRG
ncbi:PHP domain-containing protein [Anaeromyxobacter diazotrophicus]|uniref:PHP-like protein n=1 Tax=Anaeromyxobacter diazotrophicus TaxID=2590199 RepID=A0A7I9VNA0_9BACT|nr:PHP domain-containing protein [Anaeromyxobacter diazotrophicus]GEJ57884.1 PHP-like protein [Anaeromyxobacter diazotrophicus]